MQVSCCWFPERRSRFRPPQDEPHDIACLPVIISVRPCASDGYLTSGEFRAALVRLGVPVSSTHFIAFAGAPNTPLAAAIPISQCIEFVFAQRDAIQGVFQQLDVGCDGRIGESDLQIARERLNLKLSDADIKRLITIADSDESGGVVRFPRVLRRSCSRTDPCSPPLTAL
jgi:hypothetical protein